MGRYRLNRVNSRDVLKRKVVNALKLQGFNEESRALVSSLLERDLWTNISFETELLNTMKDKESLNLNIYFPVKVKRKQLYRFIDYLSDMGFMVGTASIALAKTIEGKYVWWDRNWIYFVLGGYVFYTICKGVIKLWRG